MENIISNKVKDLKTRSVEIISKLDTLSPLKTLTRGYTIAEKNKKSIKSIRELKKDDIINLKFIDGQIQSKIM